MIIALTQRVLKLEAALAAERRERQCAQDRLEMIISVVRKQVDNVVSQRIYDNLQAWRVAIADAETDHE